MRNFSDRPIGLTLAIRFGNDFADLFEVRGLGRPRRGTATAQVAGHDRVVLAYRGLDGKARSTTVTFDPAPTVLAEDHAIYRLELAPGKSRPIGLTVGCNEPSSGQSAVSFTRGLLAAGRELRAATRDATTVETSNELFNEILCRSAADLQMLMTDTPDGRYPYAGIPWYSTTFGRDGLITAIQMLWCDPSIARGVLRRLAAHQSSKSDPLSDAQPGKILHEMRSGEMAALGEVPFALYYGSVDATPLFVLLAGLYAERTGDLERSRRCGPRSRPALPGSTTMATSIATASSNISARARRASSTRAGRIPSTRSFTPTGRLPPARSRSQRCRATCMRPSPRSPAAPDA